MAGYKIDIGCGAFKKDGFLGVDFVPSPGVDHVVNLETDSLPFPDRSCEFIYSSHCIEHLSNPNRLFSEIGRVCRTGARIEIWVPYAHHNDALLLGHHQYYTEEFWNHVCVQHADFWHDKFGGYWLWKTVCYVIPGRIKGELDRLKIDINFAIRHLNNIVKEICFEFEFSNSKPPSNVLPDRNYALGRTQERRPLPNVEDPACTAIPDPDARDFTSLTVGFTNPRGFQDSSTCNRGVWSANRFDRDDNCQKKRLASLNYVCATSLKRLWKWLLNWLRCSG
jgi:SAM-dependent methyltransferase